MHRNKPNRTHCTVTGQSFLWNKTVVVDGCNCPARETPTRGVDYLHYTRCPLELLLQLNPNVRS